ncbi:MAG: hypothetical protein EOP46_07705 [Sphingobacteriaceae bacterium]|nr:MAG: hypothetical protein EOP46_07705 [Sphingobacteriaceae bacterium]
MIQKVTKKSSQQKGFFAAQGICPANQPKPGPDLFCPTAHCSRFSKNIKCPTAALPLNVLSDFARSCFADAESSPLNTRKNAAS